MATLFPLEISPKKTQHTGLVSDPFVDTDVAMKVIKTRGLLRSKVDMFSHHGSRRSDSSRGSLKSEENQRPMTLVSCQSKPQASFSPELSLSYVCRDLTGTVMVELLSL